MYGFDSQLNVTLPEELYKELVSRYGTLTKLIKVVKCVLKVLCKSPKHKSNNTIQLTAEALATLEKSSQKHFPPDLKDEIKFNDIWCVAPRFIKPDEEEVFGTKHLPIIIINDSLLVNLLVAYSH